MEPEPAVRVLLQFKSRPGLCRLARRKTVPLLRLQPAASGDSRPPRKLRPAEYGRWFGGASSDLCHLGCRCVGLRNHKYLRQCLSARPYRWGDTDGLACTPVSGWLLVPQRAGDAAKADFSRHDISICIYLFKG